MDDRNLEEQPLVYANFIQRTHAFVVDSLVFFPLSYWSSYNLIYTKNFFIVIIIALAWWVYKPLMEWKFGATLGKRVAKIKVVGTDGNRPSFNQVMLRFTPYFAIGLSQLIFNYALFNLEAFQTAATLEELQALQTSLPGTNILVSVFFYAFSISLILSDERKQALHDRYSQTYCIVDNRL